MLCIILERVLVYIDVEQCGWSSILKISLPRAPKKKKALTPLNAFLMICEKENALSSK